MALPNQQSQIQGIPATLASQVISADGSSIVNTYTVNVTQAQLTMQLAQAQQQLANLTNQQAQLNAMISSLQQQLALFPVVTSGPQGTGGSPASS